MPTAVDRLFGRASGWAGVGRNIGIYDSTTFLRFVGGLRRLGRVFSFRSSEQVLELVVRR